MNEVGRPTLYTPELLAKAKEYLDLCQDEEIQELTGLSAKGTELYKNKLKVKIPTKGGLARFLGVARDTLYDWATTYPEFSYIMEEVGAEQEDRLLNNGLSGDYNSTIAKVLLTKHGYREGIEQTGKDGKPLKIEFAKDFNKINDNATTPREAVADNPIESKV